ncbi:hypothetical protein NLM33_05885 [Bradyrhizobium sp. CCGUVB1N3]|uniref:hypothetical protein n=1 Tax=Bradyrhizobium sp. CCGUVB1N3 TaxID=2949629 RepID=UPI0020B1C622|nr:hypothetical protein [Bradyrhizobium sp. CCGUVB1N3]MCP3469859.1 hypothetical protein [Bradyrhizobium sp. CCGUVB1N3]
MALAAVDETVCGGGAEATFGWLAGVLPAGGEVVVPVGLATVDETVCDGGAAATPVGV